MPAIKVSEIRAKFPMYADLNDDQLISGIRQKFYSDIPIQKFAGMIDYDTQRASLQDEAAKDSPVLAGIGKGLTDFARGAGQLVGAVSRKDVDEANARDAGLMRTGGGKAGNFVGSVAPGLAAMLVPGGATLTGAALTGAGLGFAAPVGENDSRMLNTAIGGAAGAGGVAAARGIAGLYQGGKALLEPFTQGGRDRIAGRMIQRFADDPSKVATAQGGRTITGAAPTLAEETGDAGLARLQDALRSVDPQIENRIGQRLAENNAARVGSLRTLAGDSTQRTAAETARDATSGPLYAAAKAKALEIDPQLAELLKRPSVQSALTRAAAYAKEQGRTFGLSAAKDVPPSAVLDASGAPMVAGYTIPGKVTGQTMHDLKMGMDALLKDPTSGIAGAEAGAVRDTRALILKWLESKAPEYGQARTTYAAASKPINGMDVGEEILRRATSNTSNLAGDPRMQTNALLGILRDEPGLIARGTGRKGINALSDVFEPDQLNLLRRVASESDRSAAVASAGAGPGSATAQRMASQNVLKQIIGPTGLPSSWAESALANTVVGKPLNLVYGGVAEPKIQQALAEAVLDPVKARAFIAAAQKQGLRLPDNAATRLLMQTARTSPAAVALPQPERR